MIETAERNKLDGSKVFEFTLRYWVKPPHNQNIAPLINALFNSGLEDAIFSSTMKGKGLEKEAILSAKFSRSGVSARVCILKAFDDMLPVAQMTEYMVEAAKR